MSAGARAAVDAGEAATGDPQPSAGADALDPSVACVLAAKVLHAWLRNRYQLLYPFAVDLRRLEPAQAELVVDAMLCAAQADGAFDAKERERIAAALALVAPGTDAAGRQALVDAALARRRPLGELLGRVRDVQGGALVYAASLMAIDQRLRVNRYYLRYLAARLQLSEELAGSLEQRFRSSA